MEGLDSDGATLVFFFFLFLLAVLVLDDDDHRRHHWQVPRLPDVEEEDEDDILRSPSVGLPLIESLVSVLTQFSNLTLNG